jgi:hypothetical protein
MADKEITAQIDKLRKTRPARAVEAMAGNYSAAAEQLPMLRDDLISTLSMLRDDLKEECRLLEHAKIKGGVTLIKDRTAVAGWLELFIIQLGREAERDPTGLTVPCDGSCGNADPHNAHLAPGALGRLSPSPKLGEHRPSERGTEDASLPGPGGRCAVGNVHDEYTLKCPCGFNAEGLGTHEVRAVDMPREGGTVHLDPPVVGPATIFVRVPDAPDRLVELDAGDTMTTLTNSAEMISASAGMNQASSVADYLSGASDDIPGSAAQSCPDCDLDTHLCQGCGAPVWHGMYACLECAAQNSAAYLADAIEPLQQEVHNAIDRELPHVTADPIVDPFAPIPRVNLGTPAVPPAGHEVTTADLLTPVDASLLPAHLSFSQVTTVTDCGAKYRFQRVEQLPQVPQWANVGGKAFHACVEHVETDGAVLLTDRTLSPAGVWETFLDREIVATEQASGMVRDQFRASQQGRENYDWWRVEGAAMLRRYVDWRQEVGGVPQQVLIGPSGAPMLEWETTYDVDGVPFKTILDSVWIDSSGADHPLVKDRTAIIRDWKTGAGVPDDRQLCTQAWGLRMAGWQGSILAQFFDARKGTFTEPFDPFERMSWDDVRYFVLSGYASTRQPILPARPSDFCGGCSVAYACPIMRQRRAAKAK